MCKVFVSSFVIIIPPLGYEGPQRGPVKLICTSIYLSFCPSLRLSISLSSRPRWFLAIIYAACNFLQFIQPQATGSYTLSGSIICSSVFPSVRPVIHGPFAIFLFVLISSVGVQRRDAFSTHWVPEKPSGVHSILYICVYPYLCIYVSLSGLPHLFLTIKAHSP